MKLLKKKQQYKDDIDSIIAEINNKNTPEEYCFFIFGMFILALVFNLFYARYNIVTIGSSGLSILAKHYFTFDPSIFIFIISVILLILSFFLLDLKLTLRSVMGTILYPFFIKSTAIFADYITFDGTSLFIIMIFGGILTGFATGLIMKRGFTTGGFNILYQIFNKYFKISIGKSSFIISGIIITISIFAFGFTSAIYAVISLYIATVVTDKVILGISKNKAFYIVTDKYYQVKEFITNNLHHEVTVIDAKGGYSNDRKKILFCVVPTREYYLLKEVINEIDNDVFFLITDTYEVIGIK